MTIHLTTLGGLRARRDDVELERLIGKRLRAALLVYLAVERRAARESLMTVFWPESSTENARHALRQTLYHLRTELGADWLEVNSQEVRASADVRADVHEFIAALERGQVEAAVRLYGGPFLAGVNLVALQPWESWVESKRTQYARAFRKACREWVDSQRAAGDLQGAIEAAQRWVAPDPLDDEAQHRLISALAEAGERTAAIRQYEAYERLLQAEDLHALDETTSLMERVRSEAAVGPAPPTPASLIEYPPTGPQSEHPIVRTPAGPHNPRAEHLGARTPARPHTRTRTVAAAATVVLLLLGLAWRANLQRGKEPPVESSSTIAVLPFSVRGGSDAAYLGEGMVSVLTTALDGISVRPVDARAVFAMVAQDAGRAPALERGSRVAARLGAGLFVLGDVIEAGDSLRIEAAIYRAGAASEPVSRGAVSGNAEHVFGLIDNLAAQLLAGLGTASGDRLTRIAAVTTTSLPAFKAYLQGESEIRAGRFERAEEAYLRAVAHDSTFAIAHYRLSLALDWGARGDATAAARAAARHAQRLTPRDRALLEAFQVYNVGDAPEAERRYRAILARYPDDLEAWLQLAEVLSHYGPFRGRSISETEKLWRIVLAYEPRNITAIVHLGRFAGAAGQPATIDSLLEPFAPEELTSDRRLLQVAALGAIAARDTATTRFLIEHARAWEDGAAWQLAAYLTAFGAVPAVARQAVKALIEPPRPAAVIADLHWFAALLHLENGQITAAQRAMMNARAANATAGSQWHVHAFERVMDWWTATLPLPFPDSTIDRIRQTASATDVSRWRDRTRLDRVPDADIQHAMLRQALDVADRSEALRVYAVGTLALRLGDAAAAKSASASLTRLASSDSADWFVRALDAELRARHAWQEGRAAQALRILDEVEPGPVSGAANVIPFMALAHRRYLRGQLLSALGRDAEALSWFASLGALSAPEVAFRAPAHQRQAEIYEQQGNLTEAVEHYARVVELWQDGDAEVQPLVEAARRKMTALSRADRSRQ